MQTNSEYVRDVEGYVVDPEDWNESLAHELAAEENLELDDAYWAILGYMREYWQEHRIAPDVRHVVKFLADHMGVSKKLAKQQIFAMFPYGYVKQACKIAGMKRPRAWSTG